MALWDSNPPVSRAHAPHSTEFLPFWVCNWYISFGICMVTDMEKYSAPWRYTLVLLEGGVAMRALPLILYVLVVWNFYKLQLDKSNEDIYKPLLKRLLPNWEIISYWHWKIDWSNQAWCCGTSFSGHVQANRRKVVSKLISISIKPKGGRDNCARRLYKNTTRERLSQPSD